MKHFQYLWYIIKHKWFVLIAGLRIGASIWRLLIHDMSKLLPSEWFAYANYFYRRKKKVVYTIGSNGEKKDIPPPKADQLGQEFDWNDPQRLAFDTAWLRHQKRNAHHWQYWLLVEDKNWWSINSFDDGGPMFIAHNNKRFDFPIPFEWDDNKSYDNKSYKELLRLINTLNARPIPLPMPKKYVFEMVADWMGAGRAITGRWEVKEWYKKNKDKMLLHEATREAVEKILEVLGVGDDEE